MRGAAPAGPPPALDTHFRVTCDGNEISLHPRNEQRPVNRWKAGGALEERGCSWQWYGLLFTARSSGKGANCARKTIGLNRGAIGSSGISAASW